ncbi:MAG: hypothetical protein WCV68_01635 [Candidatus Paceibacterota bacterium]|jgi:hypothetical protein
MTEVFPSPADAKETEKKQRIEEIIALARELHERGEVFSFSGVDPESYFSMREAEEEFPGYTTPINELTQRFQTEGVKVVLGAHPESGNVFILPAESNDIEMDSIAPKQLQISEGMDGALRELITKSRSFAEFMKAYKVSL